MVTNQIVLDLETKKAFGEMGVSQPSDLGISIVGTYFYKTGTFRIYEEQELHELEQSLSQADRVIGFNIRRFDFPVLQPYLKHLKTSDIPLFDLMDELEKILGHRLSLQTIASATLGEGKSGSGLDAIHYYRSGEIEKLKSYCQDDVRLTRDLYEFGKKQGRVFYFAKDGQTKLEVAVDWKDPVPQKNLSLF